MFSMLPSPFVVIHIGPVATLAETTRGSQFILSVLGLGREYDHLREPPLVERDMGTGIT